MKLLLSLFVCLCVVALRGDVSSLNLLKDSGFEGKTGAWKPHLHGDALARSVHVSELDNMGVGSGQRCGYIMKKPQSSRFVALWQDVPVTAGKRYLLAGTLRGRGSLFFYNYGPKGEWMGSTAGVKTNGAEWISVSKEVVIKKGVTRAQIRFEIYGTDSEGEGWVDDVYFGPVPPLPEPVTGLKVTSLKDGGQELSWQPVAMKGVTYRIYRSPYPDTGSDHVQAHAVTTDTRWVDREIPRSWDRCYYQVRAMGNYHIQGGASAQVMAVPAGVPVVTEPVIWLGSPLEKFRRYQEYPATASVASVSSPAVREVQLQLARNESESVQVVIGAQSLPVKDVEVEFSGFSGAGSKLTGQAYRVHYSLMKTPTVAPLVTRPGLMGDALPPWQGKITVPAHALQSIWFQVVSAVDCPAGSYEGTLTVRSAGKPLARVTIRTQVWDFTLPVTPSFQTAFAVWPWCIDRAFGFKAHSPESRRMYEKYYWFMTERRMPPTRLPADVTSPEADRFLLDPRINGFNMAAGWQTVDQKKMKAMVDKVRRLGVLHKEFVYCYDEPTPAQYPKCRELAQKVHEVDKDIRFLLTEEPVEELKGAVDVWVPILHRFNRDECEKYRKQGNNIWWYTCVGPQAPYPTYLIDDVGVSHRVLSWLQAKYRIEGVLYWCVNLCGKYENGAYQKEVTVWRETAMFPGANGDGFLLYPGKQIGVDGPVSSIRLEVIRDGNEDVEYFTLLRSLLKKNGCQDVEGEISRLVDPVATDLTHWNKDWKVLESQRKVLAQKILELMKK